MVADQDDPIDGSGKDKEDDTRSEDIAGDEEDGDGDDDDDDIEAHSTFCSTSILTALGMLDATSTPERVHASINVFAEMKSFLHLSKAASSGHVKRVEEISGRDYWRVEIHIKYLEEVPDFALGDYVRIRIMEEFMVARRADESRSHLRSRD